MRHCLLMMHQGKDSKCIYWAKAYRRKDKYMDVIDSE